MNFRTFWFLIVFSLGYFNTSLQSNSPDESIYFNLQDYPHLKQIHGQIAPHLIPFDHPMKETLDYIFSQSRAIENEDTFIEAGFEIFARMPFSFIIVARHFAMPGYVFKVYLDSETRSREGNPNWKWLVNRCMGARRIRKFISEKKIRYFTAPHKWLYALPQYPLSREKKSEPVILIETDMELESEEESRMRWRSVKPRHLDELYTILKHGYGSTSLVKNIPSTKKGKFAFVDTEHPRRKFTLTNVNLFLNHDMQKYWDSLIKDE